MYCSNCGQQIKEIKKFCPHCGNPLPAAGAQAAVQAGTLKKPSFLFSNIALGVGILAFLAFASSLSQGQDNGLDGIAYAAISGAVAYRLVKKRKLNLLQHPEWGMPIELLLLFIMAMLILLQTNIGDKMYNNPVSYVLAPLWAIIAYLAVNFRKV